MSKAKRSFNVVDLFDLEIGDGGAYPLWESGGLLFSEIGPWTVLVDTGSGVTLWARNMLSMHVEEPFDYLLGMDVMGWREVVFDLPGAKLELGPRTKRRWFPRVRAEIAGVRHECLFDTGAPITYVPGMTLMGMSPTGRFRDFYPGRGEWYTDTYDATVRLNGVEWKERIAPLSATPFYGMDKAILSNQFFMSRRVRAGAAKEAA